MQRLLAPLARFTSDRPGRVIAALAALTVVFGIIASDQATDTELTAFAPDSALADALDRVQDEFGAGASTLQVIVDAGDDGDVLTSGGLTTALAVVDVLDGYLVEIGAAAPVDAPGAPRPAPGEPVDPDVGTVRSFAGAVAQVLEARDLTIATADEATIDDAAATALTEGAAALVATDADLAAGSARGGLVVLTFPTSMDLEDVARHSLRIDDRIRALDTASIDADVSVTAFNGAIIGSSIERQSQEEMPRLLALSLLLIVGVLFFQYRTISDVAIGFVGLIATITWMFGISVLLGPEYLGLTGPFTQISLIVPVLLVGLGIDYAIHLTSRYREEQSHAEPPARSAAMAVRSVGGALVLATVTTIVGFLTNLASPLGPIADFGVFTAVGVLSAFVIMTAFVPSVRNLLDTRRSRRPRLVRRGRPRRVEPHRPASGLANVIGRTSVLAERAPKVVLGVALLVTLATTGAAVQVETTFSQDDFIPADSETGRLIDRIDDLFAGDIEESTYVVIDGDVADAGARAAIDDFRAALVDVADVRTAVDADGVTAARADVLTSATGSTAVVAISTSAGQDRAGALAATLRPLTAPLAERGLDVTVTSEPLVLDEALDALTASQARGILITLAAALTLLVAYYGITMRAPMLGAITMIPSVAVVSWVIGTMWLLGYTFNVLTAMVASLGIGIGVPFGIHITHRFGEDRRRYATVDAAIRATVTHTGGAMAGSAATTAIGFGVLVFASLVPIRTFGLIVAITIVYSFVAAVLIQPSCLKLWADRRHRKGEVTELHEHEKRSTELVGAGSTSD